MSLKLKRNCKNLIILNIKIKRKLNRFLFDIIKYLQSIKLNVLLFNLSTLEVSYH